MTFEERSEGDEGTVRSWSILTDGRFSGRGKKSSTKGPEAEMRLMGCARSRKRPAWLDRSGQGGEPADAICLRQRTPQKTDGCTAGEMSSNEVQLIKKQLKSIEA